LKGSNRKWIAIDREKNYLEGARFRFESPWDEERRAAILGIANGNGNGHGASVPPEQMAPMSRPWWLTPTPLMRRIQPIFGTSVHSSDPFDNID
jgi:hypothetical protein